MAVRPLFNGSARVSVDNNPADPALLFRYTFRTKVGVAPAAGDEIIDNTTFQVQAGTALTIFYDLRKFGANAAPTETPTQATVHVLRDDGGIAHVETLNLGPGLPVTGSFSFTPANPGTYWLRLFMRHTNAAGTDLWSANNDDLFARAAISAITRRFTADKARIRAGGVLNFITITERGNAAPTKFATTMKADESDVEEAVRFDPAWAANPLSLSGNTLRRKNRRNTTTKSAQFTAANSESLSIADNADLSTGDIDFTFATWGYLVSKPAQSVLGGKWNGVSNQKEWLCDYESGGDRFRFIVEQSDAATGVVSASNFGSPPLGTWVFVVGWHNSVSNTVNIQVNNGPVNSVPYASGGQDNISPFRLGAHEAGTSASLNGRLDSTGFWKRVLTAAERTSLYNGGIGKRYADLTTAEKVSLVSWWDLEEVSGTRNDSHGTNHLTDNNTVTQADGVTIFDSSTALFATGVNDFAVHLLNFPAGERSYDAVFECDVNSSIHNGNTPQYSGLAAQEASGAWMHFETPGVGLTLEDFKTVAKLNTFTLDSTTTLPSIFFNNTADYTENASGVPQGTEDFSYIATAKNMQGKAGGLKNSRNELLKGVFIFHEVFHEQSGAIRDSWGLDNTSFRTNAAGWSTASRVVTVSTPPSGVHKVVAQAYFPVSSLGNASIRKLLATRTEGGSPAGADAGKDWIAPANFTASIVIFKSPTKGGELNVVTIKVYDKAALKDADFDPPVKVYKNGSATLWASLVVTKRPGVSGVYDVFLTSDAVAAGESNFYEIAVEVTVGGFLKVFGATLTAIPFELPAHAHRAGDGSKLIEVPEMDQSGNPLF